MTAMTTQTIEAARKIAIAAGIEWDAPITKDFGEYGKETAVKGRALHRTFQIDIIAQPGEAASLEIVHTPDPTIDFLDGHHLGWFEPDSAELAAAVEKAKALCQERLEWELTFSGNAEDPPLHLDF